MPPVETVTGSTDAPPVRSYETKKLVGAGSMAKVGRVPSHSAEVQAAMAARPAGSYEQFSRQCHACQTRVPEGGLLFAFAPESRSGGRARLVLMHSKCVASRVASRLEPQVGPLCKLDGWASLPAELQADLRSDFETAGAPDGLAPEAARPSAGATALPKKAQTRMAPGRPAKNQKRPKPKSHDEPSSGEDSDGDATVECGSEHEGSSEGGGDDDDGGPGLRLRTVTMIDGVPADPAELCVLEDGMTKSGEGIVVRLGPRRKLAQ